MRISSLALPIVMMPALLLGGCSSDTKKATVPSGGIYVSTSAGASFEQSVNAPDAADSNIAQYDLRSIHRSLQDPNTIIIASGIKGIVMSHDDGVTWEAIPVPELVGVIDAVQLPSGILIATGVDSSQQGAAVRSLDSGKSWQNVFTIPLPPKKSGLKLIKGPTAQSATIVVLEIDPNYPDRVWAGTNDGTILLAEQSGKVWRKVAELTSPAASVTGGRGGAGVVRLIASPGNSDELLIITKDMRLLSLKENKVDSTSSPQVTEIKVPKSAALSGSFGNITGAKNIVNVLPIVGFPDALLIGASDGASVTRDKGKTYLQLQLPINASNTFTAMGLAVSPKNVNRILIAIDSIVYRSEDSGTTWNTTDLGTSGLYITDISINPSNPARVMVVAKAVKS